jgi:hypothetical protein
MNIYGDYPFTPDEYLDLVSHYHPDLAACLDYPCEPDIARGCRLQTNTDRIEATIDHTAYLLRWTISTTRFLPVIQGYTIDEYAICIGRMATKGLLRDYMAVGSMCRRWQLPQLQETMSAIYRLVCDAGVTDPKLHWFGLKLQAIADPVCRPFIYSCDSAAWSIAPGNTGLPKYPQSPDDEQWRFERYRSRLDLYEVAYAS